MSLQTSMTTRRKFLERSALGFGSVLFLPGLLVSCTDHNIPYPEETPTIQPGLFKTYKITNNSSSPFAVLYTSGSSNTAYPQQYFETNLGIVNDAVGDNYVQTWIWQPGQTNSFRMGMDQLKFIIVKPDILQPLMVALPAYNQATNSYDLTFSEQDKESMLQADSFYRMVNVYPGSYLAKNYQQLIATLTDSSMSKGDIDLATEYFFSSTDHYKNVTLEALSAISTYYNQYPYMWAGAPDQDKTYYLYSSDGHTVTNKGSIEISYLLSAPNVPNKSLPLFTITFTNEHKQTKRLYYVDGFFVDDINADNPAVCLVGKFLDKGQLTHQPMDSGIIELSIIGAVNGISVLGINQKPEEPHSWFYMLTHPSTMIDWINIILLVAGAMIGIDEFLVAAIYLYNGIDRDDLQSDGSLADAIAKANQDRLARLKNKQRTSLIKPNTALEDIPPF